jgi:hypothetical protein
VNAAFAVETFLDGTRTDRERMTTRCSEESFSSPKRNQASSSQPSMSSDETTEEDISECSRLIPCGRAAASVAVMIEAAEDRCRKLECKFMDITVLSLRPELPAFYRKFGYIETGTEEFTSSRSPKDGVKCHCMVMSKCL